MADQFAQSHTFHGCYCCPFKADTIKEVEDHLNRSKLNYNNPSNDEWTPPPPSNLHYLIPFDGPLPQVPQQEEPIARCSRKTLQAISLPRQQSINDFKCPLIQASEKETRAVWDSLQNCESEPCNAPRPEFCRQGVSKFANELLKMTEHFPQCNDDATQRKPLQSLTEDNLISLATRRRSTESPTVPIQKDENNFPTVKKGRRFKRTSTSKRNRTLASAFRKHWSCQMEALRLTPISEEPDLFKMPEDTEFLASKEDDYRRFLGDVMTSSKYPPSSNNSKLDTENPPTESALLSNSEKEDAFNSLETLLNARNHNPKDCGYCPIVSEEYCPDNCGYPTAEEELKSRNGEIKLLATRPAEEFSFLDDQGKVGSVHDPSTKEEDFCKFLNECRNIKSDEPPQEENRCKTNGSNSKVEDSDLGYDSRITEDEISRVDKSNPFMSECTNPSACRSPPREPRLKIRRRETKAPWFSSETDGSPFKRGGKKLGYDTLQNAEKEDDSRQLSRERLWPKSPEGIFDMSEMIERFDRIFLPGENSSIPDEISQGEPSRPLRPEYLQVSRISAKITNICKFCKLSGFTHQEIEQHTKICSKKSKCDVAGSLEAGRKKPAKIIKCGRTLKGFGNPSKLALPLNVFDIDEVEIKRRKGNNTFGLETIWEEKGDDGNREDHQGVLCAYSSISSETPKIDNSANIKNVLIKQHGMLKEHEGNPTENCDEAEDIIYVSEVVNSVNSSFNLLRNRLSSIEERLKDVGVRFLANFNRLKKSQEEQKSKMCAIELAVGLKREDILFKCCLLESKMNSKRQEPVMPKINRLEPSCQQCTIFPVKSCSSERGWKLMLKNLFPTEKYVCFKRLKWSSENYFKRKNKGFWLEKWFHCRADEYDYRCYLYPSDDNDFIDARIWIDKDKKPHMLWPPVLRVVLGILDSEASQEDSLLFHKSLAYPEGFREIYPNWSGVYLFSHFISFKDIEDPQTEIMKHDRLSMVIYFLS